MTKLVASSGNTSSELFTQRAPVWGTCHLACEPASQALPDRGDQDAEVSSGKAVRENGASRRPRSSAF